MKLDTGTDKTRIVAAGVAAAIAFAIRHFPGGVPAPEFNQALTGENA